jgi:hypothetical protein
METAVAIGDVLFIGACVATCHRARRTHRRADDNAPARSRQHDRARALAYNWSCQHGHAPSRTIGRASTYLPTPCVAESQYRAPPTPDTVCRRPGYDSQSAEMPRVNPIQLDRGKPIIEEPPAETHPASIP